MSVRRKRRVWSDDEKRVIYAQTRAPASGEQPLSVAPTSPAIPELNPEPTGELRRGPHPFQRARSSPGMEDVSDIRCCSQYLSLTRMDRYIAINREASPRSNSNCGREGEAGLKHYYLFCITLRRRQSLKAKEPMRLQGFSLAVSGRMCYKIR